MCGIAGTFANYEPKIGLVESTLKFMCHRGPDDQKYKSFLTKNGKHATLLFSRLAIIDLDPRANQPMLYKGIWLTFNGEIYNYKEIRKELESVGKKFITNSDTEVLLKALHTYGWEVLDKLEGMWSIAVYDENTNRLSLCRDRFGEKPLIYMKIDGGIVYASEIKILEKLSGKTLQPNKSHIQRFLVNGYKSLYKTTDTFYEGVIDVPSSTLIHYNEDGTTENIKYWKPKIETNRHLSFLEATNETRNKLTKSLEL
jgi:asparagine synthase (glutamine-hydrolysing)